MARYGRRVFEGVEVAATLMGVALEHEGIRCEVRDLPAVVAPQPQRREVLIMNPADAARARLIVARFEKGANPSEAVLLEAWPCPSCGETIEGQFLWCWKCGATKG